LRKPLRNFAFKNKLKHLESSLIEEEFRSQKKEVRINQWGIQTRLELKTTKSKI
jgi:hypothetical protein